MTESEFDLIADKTLRSLQRALDELDGVEAELSQGVLTISFEAGAPYVVNSHRAALQIWMAAERTAWHFDPISSQEGLTWVSTKAPNEELRGALASVLSRKLGRSVALS
ncbi:MAG: iron donor protein CyaY [Polyangiaceae bacterium]